MLSEHSGRAILSHEVFSPAWKLGLWVQIPIKAWMSVYVYSVCAVLRVGSGLATGWSSAQGVLQSMYRIIKLKAGNVPTTGCRAIVRWTVSTVCGYLDKYGLYYSPSTAMSWPSWFCVQNALGLQMLLELTSSGPFDQVRTISRCVTAPISLSRIRALRMSRIYR
jgi:hypothetical protein